MAGIVVDVHAGQAVDTERIGEVRRQRKAELPETGPADPELSVAVAEVHEALVGTVESDLKIQFDAAEFDGRIRAILDQPRLRSAGARVRGKRRSNEDALKQQRLNEVQQPATGFPLSSGH